MRTTPTSIVSILLILGFGGTPAVGDDVSLQCRPAFGIDDHRPLRPEYVQHHRARYTYFLFSNADLLYYKVLLWNKSDEQISLPQIEDWGEDLSFSISRDGVELPTESLAIERIAPYSEELLSKPPWYEFAAAPEIHERFLEGQSEFGTAATNGRLPDSLRPREKVGYVFHISQASGDPLDDGLYTVDVRSKTLGSTCSYPQLIVLLSPKTELDRVDDHLVRYNYFRAFGQLPRAQAELERAAAEAPGNLKILYHLAAYYIERENFDALQPIVKDLQDALIEEKSLVSSPIDRVYQRLTPNLLQFANEQRVAMEPAETQQE